MKFKSEHMTQASGSIAGVTYARSKGGVLYRRARAIPVNPNSPFQGQVRAALSNLVNMWISTLTAAQRLSWDTYAANVTVTNVLGDAVHNSGQNWFIACNLPLLQATAKLAGELGPFLSAPTTYDRGDFTTPSTPTLDAVTGFSMPFTNTDPWADAAPGVMHIYMGRPRNASRSFFKGPYRLVGQIVGEFGAAPASPFTITAATLASIGFTLVAGQKVRFEVAVSQSDGRLSTRRSLGDVIVTP